MEYICNRVIDIRFGGLEKTVDMNILVYLIPMDVIAIKPYLILVTLLISRIQKKWKSLKRTTICCPVR